MQTLRPEKVAAALRRRIKRDFGRGVFNGFHVDIYARVAAIAIVEAKDRIAAAAHFLTANPWE